MLRVAIALMLLGGGVVAHAQMPSTPYGYRCGAGKPDLGKGCACPAEMVAERTADNHAICAKRAAPTCKDAATQLRKMFVQSDDYKGKIPEGKRAAFSIDLQVLLERRCKGDGWSAPVVACFARATTEAKTEACAKQLSEAQLRGIDRGYEALLERVTAAGRVVVTNTQVAITTVVSFASGRANIASPAMLDDLVRVLNDNPTLQLRIEGHTDSQEPAAAKLGLARAQAVRSYLVGNGIAADRLVAKGFGPTLPVASNSTEEGRASNRRVSFVVTSR